MNRVLAFVVACVLCSPVVAAEPTADDYINFFKPFTGEFTVKVKTGDLQVDAQFSGKLLADTKCFITSLSGVYTSIDGYDAAAKKWKTTWFDTAGDHWVIYLSANVATLKNRKPATLDCSAKQIKPDGTIVQWKSKRTYTFNDKKIVMKITEETSNGEKRPDKEFIFTPKK